ncbi:MAG: hypothetical protein HGB28_02155 [Oscillochloris sp.]|nr:hypothetical protein [Oscillochloris sp.]
MQPAAGATERVMPLGDLYERLPIFTKGRKPGNIKATDLYLFTNAALPSATLVQRLKNQEEETPFAAGPTVRNLQSFAIKDIDLSMSGWTLKIGDVKTEVSELWLVVRYKLGK